MRFEAAVQTFFRTTMREIEVAGVKLGELRRRLNNALRGLDSLALRILPA